MIPWYITLKANGCVWTSCNKSLLIFMLVFHCLEEQWLDVWNNSVTFNFTNYGKAAVIVMVFIFGAGDSCVCSRCCSKIVENNWCGCCNCWSRSHKHSYCSKECSTCWVTSIADRCATEILSRLSFEQHCTAKITHTYETLYQVLMSILYVHVV
jgi:hypothetical protein